jgi:flagellar biosynthesis/type III secretory pathway protein FliH
LPPGLTDWITCLLHSPHEEVMSQITHPPAKQAVRHLETMLTDEQLRWQAFYQETAQMEERILLGMAHNKGKKEGREEGREEGLKEGRAQRAQILLRQLTRKFGPLSPTTQQRVNAAGTGELDTWALKLLDAKTLDEVFAANPPAP